MGGFTKPVLKLCGIAMMLGDGDGHGGEGGSTRPPASPALKPEQTSKRSWKRMLLKLDRKVLRPVLIAGYEDPAQ